MTPLLTARQHICYMLQSANAQFSNLLSLYRELVRYIFVYTYFAFTQREMLAVSCRDSRQAGIIINTTCVTQ